MKIQKKNPLPLKENYRIPFFQFTKRTLYKKIIPTEFLLKGQWKSKYFDTLRSQIISTKENPVKQHKYALLCLLTKANLS